MEVTCGPLTFTFENGFIRHVRRGDEEILRMVYFALRDADWETLPLQITDLVITHDNHKFEARYQAINVQGNENVLKWNANITVTGEGMITFSIQGIALKSFRRNRAGFCVLHPIKECIDKPVIIYHPEGSKTYSTFPSTISAKNPFVNISGMAWEGSPGRFQLTFEGDVFETEDQRNWTDASFKTFCTPLSLPWPVTLNPGDQISQVIIFQPQQKLERHSAKSDITLKKGAVTRPLPHIGLGYSAVSEITAAVSEKIRQLKLHHVRCGIDLSADTLETTLANSIQSLKVLQLPLELVLLVDKPDLAGIVSAVQQIMQREISVISLTLVSESTPTTTPEVISLIPELKRIFPGLPIGAGTNFNFTEINRNRFDPGLLDFISFSINPQEHAVDDTTIIENLEAQQYAVESARTIYNLPVRISPLTLKRRYNPYTDNLHNRVVPLERQFDARLQQPFGAVFTLGSIKRLCDAGAVAVSFHQLVGKLGVLDSSAGSHHVFSALKELSNFQKAMAFETFSSHPLVADGIFFNDAVLAWNYTSSSIRIHVNGIAHPLEPYAFRTIAL